MAPWRRVSGYQRFEGMLAFSTSSTFLDCLTLKMETSRSFETSGTTGPKTNCHIPEEFNFLPLNCHIQRRGNTMATEVCGVRLMLLRWHYSAMPTFASFMDFSQSALFSLSFRFVILHLLLVFVHSCTICFLVFPLFDFSEDYCKIFNLLFLYYPF
jgi:hypothetical protein